MTTGQQVNSLIASLEQAVGDGLAYFAGPGAASGVRVGEWGPWEVLCHMIFWHRATAEGMESAAKGGEPYRVEATADEMNEISVKSMAGRSTGELIDQIGELQGRLVAAARALPDPGATVFVSRDGTESSALQRLELIAGHWNEHLRELRR